MMVEEALNSSNPRAAPRSDIVKFVPALMFVRMRAAFRSSLVVGCWAMVVVVWEGEEEGE